jgi:soluble lytic murein transglycosylase-like protein
VSGDLLTGLTAGGARAAAAGSAALRRDSAAGGAGSRGTGETSEVARRTAKSIRDFQALFLMEMMKPLTQELSGTASEETEDAGFGLSSGADVYSYFWGEALAQHLAVALPGLPGMTAVEGKKGETASAGLGAGLPKMPGFGERLASLGIPALTALRAAGSASPDATAAAAPASVPAARTRGASALPEAVHELAGKVGRLFSLPENLVRAVVSVESGGRADAVSGKGAVGLMQLMPGTAKEMGIKDPRDVWDNLVGGAKYLARQLERFGSLDQALAAYNAGPGAVEKHGGVPPYPETRDYVRRVLAAKASLDRTHPTGS